jgi:hypothetical protein
MEAVVAHGYMSLLLRSIAMVDETDSGVPTMLGGGFWLGCMASCNIGAYHLAGLEWINCFCFCHHHSRIFGGRF